MEATITERDLKYNEYELAIQHRDTMIAQVEENLKKEQGRFFSEFSQQFSKQFSI